MQAAHTRHPFRAGTEHEVISIAEDDIRPGLSNLIHVNAFDGPGRPDGHKGRRADIPARRAQHAGSGLTLRRLQYIKWEFCHYSAFQIK